ncbi:hypothetical protein HYPSUDRAFT_210000 [Hypholoma sublateritium FD-334 SS-4]|uniref:Uncharacterized protein n=1 Tax=Hypholoma sublateritium (strain FD-334 SS-4) TaxID=945553 RepID=A0A0D2N141_HYPSF|nr:hypothetical protein HYPSUDRAFT_210000 [Hypholoma sublateritium FD-334 SS-4]
MRLTATGGLSCALCTLQASRTTINERRRRVADGHLITSNVCPAPSSPTHTATSTPSTTAATSPAAPLRRNIAPAAATRTSPPTSHTSAIAENAAPLADDGLLQPA